METARGTQPVSNSVVGTAAARQRFGRAEASSACMIVKTVTASFIAVSLLQKPCCQQRSCPASSRHPIGRTEQSGIALNCFFPFRME